MYEVVENPSTNLKPDEFEVVLTAGNEDWQSNDFGPYAWAKKTWCNGASVVIDLSMTPEPEDDVLSGGPEIMRDNKYLVNEPKNRWCTTYTARTAVALSSDRQNLMVVTAEGPPKWGDQDLKRCPVLFGRALGLHALKIFPGFTGISKGATTRTLYRFFTECGYPHAINLDGGSSATMVIKKAEKCQVVNTLMEEKEPVLATALGFAPR